MSTLGYCNHPTFAYNDRDEVEFDPDRSIVDAIRLVFDSFRRKRSAMAVVKWMHREKVAVPTRPRRGPTGRPRPRTSPHPPAASAEAADRAPLPATLIHLPCLGPTQPGGLEPLHDQRHRTPRQTAMHRDVALAAARIEVVLKNLLHLSHRQRSPCHDIPWPFLERLQGVHSTHESSDQNHAFRVAILAEIRVATFDEIQVATLSDIASLLCVRLCRR